MIAKIVQGNSFSGAINYVLNRKEADVIATKGVRNIDKESIIHSFITQAKLNPIAKPVAHISLDFSAQDKGKLTDKKMLEIASQYLQKMGYKNTQVVAVRHHNTDHPHLHLIINRIDFNGKRISDQNEKIRNVKICRELTAKHGLYVSSGKENVKRERLREPEATKYRIYDSLVKNVLLSKSWAELQKRLKADGIEIGFKTKGSTSHIEGVRFTMNNLSFNGSKVDRQFSYSKIDFALNQNARLAEIPAPAADLGLDLGLFEQHGFDYDEEEFRRRMQRKKKKELRF